MATAQPLKSRFVNGGCPTRCQACGEPFRLDGTHLAAWRQGSFYFCSEFCAEGYEEVSPKRRVS